MTQKKTSFACMRTQCIYDYMPRDVTDVQCFIYNEIKFSFYYARWVSVSVSVLQF